jgi:hypothetical protein
MWRLVARRVSVRAGDARATARARRRLPRAVELTDMPARGGARRRGGATDARAVGAEDGAPTGDPDDPAVAREFWESLWRRGEDVFTLEGMNPNLLTHWTALLGGTGERRRVLLPMCGRSADLAHLARGGHDVVGVEYVAEAVEGVGRLQGVLMRRGPVRAPGSSGGFDVYTCDVSRARGSLVLLCGDIMDLNVWSCGGKFDAIWDRGGLSTIARGKWPAYLSLCHALLVPNGARSRGGSLCRCC